MTRILIFIFALLPWTQAYAQTMGQSSGGSSSIVSGTTPLTCTSGTTGVLYQSSGTVTCDSGLTNAGATGPVTAAGLIGSSSAGTAAAPSVFVGNSTTGLYSVSTTGFGVAINGTSRLDYAITTAASWTVASSSNFIVAGNMYASYGGTGHLYLGTGGPGDFSVASGVTNATIAGSGATFGFAASNATGGADVTISRQGAGVLQIGSGSTAGANGSLLVTNITASGANVLLTGINATTETDMLCFNTGTGLVTHSTIAQQCTVSDINKKQDIVPIDPQEALKIAIGIDPIWFRYRPEADMGSDLHTGFTMQRVGAIEPRLATTTGVKYGEMNPIWAGAIQRLQTEIDELKNAK